MKYENFDVGGELIKDNAQYQLFDNKTLKNLMLSKTKLRAGQSTNGHRHAGQEEVYIFTKGEGKMELDYKMFDVKEGDIVLIEDNVFHKVHNTGDYWLEFVCVFDGKRYDA
jgi:quercetin dioxygenase-like cupin family protein